jgi:Imelysin
VQTRERSISTPTPVFRLVHKRCLAALLLAALMGAGTRQQTMTATAQAAACAVAVSAFGQIRPAPAALATLATQSDGTPNLVRFDALLASATEQPDGSIRVALADPYANSTDTVLDALILDPAACGHDTDTATLEALQTSRDAFIAPFGAASMASAQPLWRYAQITGFVSAPQLTNDGSAAASPIEIAPVLKLQLVALDSPITLSTYDEPVDVYRTLVTGGLQTLSTDTDQLLAAVSAGRLDDARALWLKAHLDYARLGAAYDTFAEFNDRIDGRADGLAGGAADPEFSGFPRLEYGLWNDQGDQDLQGVTQRLDDDVHGLLASFPNQETDPLSLPLRAHEILENALQFELTGDTDEGSHTTLATVRANVDGTRIVLDALRPMLEPRSPRVWETVVPELDALATELDSYQRADGTWTSLDQLTRSEREHLNGSLGQLLEDLSPIPDVLELPPPPPR